ncbi:hypothetical protein BDF14DRAFT_1955083 [Spinellus fusiger]|nr:hypothetical protein BDF14DRAFT_1955083 [Spinellus fusiger]
MATDHEILSSDKNMYLLHSYPPPAYSLQENPCYPLPIYSSCSSSSHGGGSERTVLILRDIPEANEQEVLGFLYAIGSPPILAIHHDLSMWYITFAYEADAVTMLVIVRQHLFKGQSVATRIKSTSECCPLVRGWVGVRV